MTKQSALMTKAEQTHGKPIDELVPELLETMSYQEAADTLGISKATLNYWLLKLRVNIQRVVLRPGDVLTIRHADGSEKVIQNGPS